MDLHRSRIEAGKAKCRVYTVSVQCTCITGCTYSIYIHNAEWMQDRMDASKCGRYSSKMQAKRTLDRRTQDKSRAEAGQEGDTAGARQDRGEWQDKREAEKRDSGQEEGNT